MQCAACRGEADAISELLARFEDWDAPAMPQEVALRIDAALARESAARAATAGNGAASKSAGSNGATSRTTPRRARSRWLNPRGLGWALASLVLVAGGVGLGLKVASSSGTTAAGSNASSAGVAASPAQPFAAPNRGDMRSEGASPSPDRAAPDSQLAVWTKRALASSRPFAAQQAAACLSDPAFAGRERLATVDGTYDGTAATLVVLANPGDPSYVLALVFAQPCTAANHHLLAESLVAR